MEVKNLVKDGKDKSVQKSKKPVPIKAYKNPIKDWVEKDLLDIVKDNNKREIFINALISSLKDSRQTPQFIAEHLKEENEYFIIERQKAVKVMAIVTAMVFMFVGGVLFTMYF